MKFLTSTQTLFPSSTRAKTFEPFILIPNEQNIYFTKQTIINEQSSKISDDRDEELKSQQPFEGSKGNNPLTEGQNSSDSKLQEYCDKSQKTKPIRKRKNKRQKNKQIETCQKDDGRGGNCIASNISKTLSRIISVELKKQVFYKFEGLLNHYKVKSQKQNTIILLVLLYVFAEENLISLECFEKIFNHFFQSLRESEMNCEKKMIAEESRKNFHSKNKRMYAKFIKINYQLYELLIKNIGNEQKITISLSNLQEIISETYDRKQRQIQKAMNKIKSIILNHTELKDLFCYYQNRLEQAFEESIEYAFRRNLPKRCKQIKSKVHEIFSLFYQNCLISTMQDKYTLCYIAAQLVNDKSQQIWEEFITNLKMKNQFNLSQLEIKDLQLYLRQAIPLKVKEMDQEGIDSNQTNVMKLNKCKIQEEIQFRPLMNTHLERGKEIFRNQKSISEIYKKLKNNYQY